MRKIEVCCGSLYEVREAEAGGAVRVELCGAIACGGVTPSYGVLRQVAEANLKIDVNVLIRPREGSFLYSSEELDAMCRDIVLCRELGLHGVVIGALTAEGDVDTEACRKMMEAAGDMSVTFHRAFDVCRDPKQALEDIISLGCHRLLSSGQECSAELGAELLAELVRQADGRIIVMPGAGIRPSNIALIEQKTGAAEFHSTARITRSDGMNFSHPRVSFAVSPSDEGRTSLSDRAIVSQLVNNRL
ncbi:MAG: copper homeostasis protein CutC [Alistipes sp.]|nr:copper homeostasis protein CutC [Alistipes sp.]